MKLLIICVCYNNPDDFIKYLHSIRKSKQFSEQYSNDDQIDITIHVVNNGDSFNSSIKHEFEKKSSQIRINILEGQGNIGYFPGLLHGWKNASKEKFDMVIVSNIDLELSENFLLKLNSAVDKSKKIIVAPSIISGFEKKDRNPKIINRPSKKAMLKYLFLYSIPYFHHLYKTLLYPRKKIIDTNNYDQKKIYAPHGSFIIFSNVDGFISQYLSYPVFLFGEEIFVGEKANYFKHDVIYLKDIIVNDSDHATTSLQKENFIRKHNLAAIKYLYSNFWKHHD